MRLFSFFICFVIFSCYSCDVFEEAANAVIGCLDELSFNYNPEATESSGDCASIYGCLNYQSNSPYSGDLTNTFGDPYWDQLFWEENAICQQFFNDIYADVRIFQEASPDHANAYASSDGNIRFGYHMFWSRLSQFGGLSVAGILAHEWGHRAQQTIGWYDYTHDFYRELEADALSGFYLGLTKQVTWADLQGYLASTFSSGDYAFNSPGHHGTPDERFESAYLGLILAVDALQNGTQYTYQGIHDIIQHELNTRIAVRSAEENYDFEEVSYPEGLTEAYIQSLFPTI